MNKFNKLFEKLISEAQENNVSQEEIVELTKDQVEAYLSQGKYWTENKRGVDEIVQITKTFYTPNMHYLAIIVDEKIAAISTYLKMEENNKNIIFLNEVVSFKKGCGKTIIDASLDLDADLIFFNANWEAGETLLNYYRKNFGPLIEYKNENGHVFFIKTNNFNEEELEEFKKKNPYIKM